MSRAVFRNIHVFNHYGDEIAGKVFPTDVGTSISLWKQCRRRLLLHVGFCQNGNVTNREFIEMLGVVLSVSREFRVYPVALDWNPGQGVGQAINLDNHPVSILNYVILDRCQIVPDLSLHRG